ncbi:hypothetical protein [uncultured Pedobacter sp.]
MLRAKNVGLITSVKPIFQKYN